MFLFRKKLQIIVSLRYYGMENLDDKIMAFTVITSTKNYIIDEYSTLLRTNAFLKCMNMCLFSQRSR